MQCTSCYPTIDDEVNLNVINFLRDKTNLTIGYSHHNSGSLALTTAYTLGAEILEFHFTDNRAGKIFRDHKISLNRDETLTLVENIKRIKKLLGSKIKSPTRGEIISKNIKTLDEQFTLKRFKKRS